MNTTTHPDPQPTLPADLFNDLFDPTLSTLEVCRTHALSFSDLRAVLESDEFQQAMADLTAIERTRAKALAPERRERALQTLDAIARQPPSTPSHTETVRKAAAALARAAAAPPVKQARNAVERDAEQAAPTHADADSPGNERADHQTDEPDPPMESLGVLGTGLVPGRQMAHNGNRRDAIREPAHDADSGGRGPV